MGFHNKNISLGVYLLFILCICGCGVINLNNQSLEEYGDKVRLTMATLVTYIGKSKEDVKKNFGDPTEIKKPGWYAGEQYEELWYYIYRRGIPGINAVGSTKRFFFNDGKVMEVDAF